MGGGVNGPGQSTSGLDQSPPDTTVAGNGSGSFAGQNRVNSFVSNGADLSAQAVISGDRRYVRLSLSPSFNTVGRVLNTPVVSNPLIPGGPQQP